MMIEFEKVYDIFLDYGLQDPVRETWQLFRLLSGKKTGIKNRSRLEIGDINLPMVAQKRKEGVPMEYIIGSAWFGDLALYCSADTLVPTECTTLLVNVALDFIRRQRRNGQYRKIIEVGTGCGNIAVMLAKKAGNVKIVASDMSPEALKIAQKNIDEYKLNNSICLVYGNLFEPFRGTEYQGQVDMVVSNPPYIPTASLAKLSPEVAAYPRIALDGGFLGISFFQELAQGAAPVLKRGGLLLFEIGQGQENFAAWILNRNGGYEDIGYHADPEGIVRVISARRKTNGVRAV